MSKGQTLPLHLHLPLTILSPGSLLKPIDLSDLKRRTRRTPRSPKAPPVLSRASGRSGCSLPLATASCGLSSWEGEGACSQWAEIPGQDRHD